MPFQTTVTELLKDGTVLERFKQTVDHLNLTAVIQAVNMPVAAPKKPRKDKGVVRGPKTQPAAV